MSIRAVITEGLGSFGTIPDVVRQGYGIGLAEEAGIGLAPPAAVDFVIAPRQFAHEHAQFRYDFRDVLRSRNVVNIKAARREKAELREMTELYALWRRAA